MAPTGHFEGDLNTIQELLGIPRAQAVILLEKYGNVEQAVNQYFEEPIGAVKPQAPENQWEPADNIPYADDTTELPAMSRPPSRANRVADVGSGRVQTEAEMPSAEDMQDPDLQRAIAMSRQDLSGQEIGVVETDQQFGPANRPYYDSNQWAITTISSSREIVDHPPPVKRQRLPGQPAFLRGSSETGYLAPLLNIYHSIPLAREAFLLPSLRVLSYGHDPQWWSGASDENTKSISIGASDRSSQDRHNLLAELQCLMAFLDGTTRAYGSVDALADLRSLKMYNSETPLSRLLESWVTASMIEFPDNQLTQIFTSTAIKAFDVEGYSPIQKDLVCLEPPVRRRAGQDLTNLLDSTIWDDVSDRIDDIWIQQCAEIFTMRLYDPSQENKGLGLEIPLVWYPDRYIYEYREVTRQWRREMLAIRHEINQCSLIQRRCESAQGPGKRVIKIRDVLEAASKLSKADSDTVDSSNNMAQGMSCSSSIDDESIKAEKMRSELQAILQRIDEKITTLEERKQELHNQIRTIASQLTQPLPESTFSPRHKYHLQGVSTKPNITYIRQSKEEPQTLIDTTIDSDTPAFQWWRIVWGKDERVIAHSAQPPEQQHLQQDQSIRNLMANDSIDYQQAYAVHMVDEAEVIQAAKVENNCIVLVYANDNAMNFSPSSSGPALRKFVEQDNRAFQDELNRDPTNSQRKNSQDTNTTIMDDMAYDDQSATPGNLREMTPMSTTSSLRDADGQPSPKRPKGDEVYQVYREVDSDDEPPPYEDPSPVPQMQEKKVNKIGILADQMLEKYGGDGIDRAEGDGPVHIEHAKEPLR